MKLEANLARPPQFKEEWPGQYDIFHWFEYICGIPHTLFMITTYKENGKPNACFHSWSSFFGDGGGFYAVMPGILHHTHTYQNILRTGEFCVNFLSPHYFDACGKTIESKDIHDDEFAVAGFTAESCKTVQCPRIMESFLTLECRVELKKDLSQQDTSSLIVGKVESVAMEESFAASLDARYGPDGFMFNIHKPMHPSTGEGKFSAVGILNLIRKYE